MKNLNLLILYGSITFISLIEDFVTTEEYEKAKILKDILDELNLEYKLNIPTQISQYGIENWISDMNKFRFSLDLYKKSVLIALEL